MTPLLFLMGLGSHDLVRFLLLLVLHQDDFHRCLKERRSSDV